MRHRFTRPFAVTALLLVGLVPVQAGLSGTLGAAERHAVPMDGDAGWPAGMDGLTAHGELGPSQYHDPSYDHDPHADAATPEAEHEHDMPCSEEGLCDTGLMSCSAESPCVTLFFSPAAVSAPIVRMIASDERAPVGIPSEDFVPFHGTPPPRA